MTTGMFCALTHCFYSGGSGGFRNELPPSLTAHHSSITAIRYRYCKPSPCRSSSYNDSIKMMGEVMGI